MADQLLREVDLLPSDVNRKYVPGHNKEGSISFYALLNQVPAILSLPVRLFQVGACEKGASPIMTHDTSLVSIS